MRQRQRQRQREREDGLHFSRESIIIYSSDLFTTPLPLSLHRSEGLLHCCPGSIVSLSAHPLAKGLFHSSLHAIGLSSLSHSEPVTNSAAPQLCSGLPWPPVNDCNLSLPDLQWMIVIFNQILGGRETACLVQSPDSPHCMPVHDTLFRTAVRDFWLHTGIQMWFCCFLQRGTHVPHVPTQFCLSSAKIACSWFCIDVCRLLGQCWPSM